MAEARKGHSSHLSGFRGKKLLNIDLQLCFSTTALIFYCVLRKIYKQSSIFTKIFAATFSFFTFSQRLKIPEKSSPFF